MRFFNKSALVLLSCLIFNGCSDDDAPANFTISASGSAAAAAFSSFIPEGTPTSILINLYSIRVSTNTDCTGSVEITNNGASGTEFNFAADPTLFSGVVTDGTYSCIILEMSDVIKFTADSGAVSAHAACTDETTVFQHDIYRDGESDDGDWVDVSGNSIDATGTRAAPGSDRIFIYSSTDEAALLAGTIAPNVHQVISLNAALVVPGSTTFFAGFDDAIDESGGHCVLEGGSGFGFR